MVEVFFLLKRVDQFVMEIYHNMNQS